MSNSNSNRGCEIYLFGVRTKKNACPKLPECLVFSMEFLGFLALITSTRSTAHRCAGNCWKAFLLAKERCLKISLLKMLHSPIVILTHPGWRKRFQKEPRHGGSWKGPAGPSKMTSPTWWIRSLEVSTIISIGNTSTQLIHGPFSSQLCL